MRKRITVTCGCSESGDDEAKIKPPPHAAPARKLAPSPPCGQCSASNAGRWSVWVSPAFTLGSSAASCTTRSITAVKAAWRLRLGGKEPRATGPLAVRGGHVGHPPGPPGLDLGASGRRLTVRHQSRNPKPETLTKTRAADQVRPGRGVRPQQLSPQLKRRRERAFALRRTVCALSPRKSASPFAVRKWNRPPGAGAAGAVMG